MHFTLKASKMYVLNEYYVYYYFQKLVHKYICALKYEEVSRLD